MTVSCLQISLRRVDPSERYAKSAHASSSGEWYYLFVWAYRWPRACCYRCESTSSRIVIAPSVCMLGLKAFVGR